MKQRPKIKLCKDCEHADNKIEFYITQGEELKCPECGSKNITHASLWSKYGAPHYDQIKKDYTAMNREKDILKKTDLKN